MLSVDKYVRQRISESEESRSTGNIKIHCWSGLRVSMSSHSCLDTFCIFPHALEKPRAADVEDEWLYPSLCMHAGSSLCYLGLLADRIHPRIARIGW